VFINGEDIGLGLGSFLKSPTLVFRFWGEKEEAKFQGRVKGMQNGFCRKEKPLM